MFQVPENKKKSLFDKLTSIGSLHSYSSERNGFSKSISTVSQTKNGFELYVVFLHP